MRCNLCPRRCNAPRTERAGEGRCGMPAQPVLARAALHHWEEPPISGARGSGAIFFSGCPLGCVFCQNHQISWERYGKLVTLSRLREICLDLKAQGAHNLNFVSPTHYTHVLLQLLEEPLGLPVVWNTGGYERVSTLRRLEGKVDIYLPDLKYLSSSPAQRYSAAPDYPQRATAAIREMVRQTGPVVLDREGLLRRGVLIRHLVLPGQVPEAKAVMDWVAETFPPGTVLFSLMGQYLPLGRAREFPEIDRLLRQAELRSARTYMENLGLAGFTQERASASADYVPNFDLTGVESNAAPIRPPALP